MASGLLAYLDSVKSRDPAARSRWEILLYPGVLALGMHRIIVGPAASILTSFATLWM